MSGTTFTVGDFGVALTGTCSRQVGSTKTAANITGSTLALHIQKPSGQVVTKVASIVSGPAGTWTYTWLAGELDTAGAWLVECEVTFSGGTGVETFGPDIFPVKPQLG